MKLRRRRASEVPPKIKSFINGVTAAPLESIEELLKSFFWDFDKGDFHHWIDLFNHFDTFFEKYIKPRKDLQVEDDFLEFDPPFPRGSVLQILRVVRIILENCTNKHFYSSYEHHLSSLLASTDADVVEACLQTLSAFLKKSIGKHIIRDASLNSKLFAFAQGWGGKDEGLGLVSCAVENISDSVAHELGSTLHFEFYAVNESSNESNQGLQIIHLPKIDAYEKSDLELLHKLVEEYKVPPSLRFSLLTRLRFARAFTSFTSRQQYTCIRLHAFVVLVQACGDTDDLVSFFNTEPEFINELVTLLSYEDAVPEKIRILSLSSLVALCQDRSRQPTVLSAVTSGGHRGILSSLMQKAIDSVVSKSSKGSILFAEALLSLVTVLVSSSSGCSAMREAGFIPTLLPLLKNTDPQHLHLVGTAVHVLEAFMDYSNPAAALFRDLGGLDDTIYRLKVEVSHVENGSKQEGGSGIGTSTSVEMESSESDHDQPLYSEALVSYHRRSLMKALLRAISLGTYAPGTTARVYGSEESLLPHCLYVIFKKAKDFGGGMFSLAAIVMSDLIHKDPTCYSILEEASLPSAFLDAIMDGVVCSGEAITCIPQCLDALCLNNNGLQAVKDRNALRCFVKIFTSRMYLRALMGDTPSSLSSGLDELMRHASSLRAHGVDTLIEILKAIEKLGSGPEATSSTVDAPSSSSVPMETDADDKIENPEKNPEQPSDASSLNVETFLPDCVNNAARLLETILQNSDTCRIFVDKKGIEAVLQLFTLPLMPSSVSVGQSISVAFKNFSPHHSASLARALCLFLREHLKSTNELLVSLGGMQLAQVDESKRTKVLKCLSSLEGILSLSNALSKGTTNLVSELGTSDADVLKDLGVAYREILWQVSVSSDSKVDEKKSSEAEAENATAGGGGGSSGGGDGDAAIAASNERESDDDTSMPVVRYMNPVSVRNSTHPHWGLERDFVSVVRSGEGFSRRSRHGLARIRGGRTGRHLEALHIDPEASMSNTEVSSAQDLKKKTPEALVMESLNKLASTIRSFFTTLVKGFPSSNRRRAETGSLSTASKNIGTALAKIFLEALGFQGYSMGSGFDMLSVKCCYLGKVVDHMAALTFDNRRRICYTVMINNFYVQGTFKELLNTFEATSQLLWSLPHSASTSGGDNENGEGSKLSHGSWLLDTLQSYCRLLEFFVNSTFLLPPTSTSQAQLLVQPVAVGLSIGLFPVPRDPEVFVRMLQSQVLDVILPIWNHPMLPNCNPGFITSIVTLVTHVYCGVGDAKRTRSGVSGSGSQRFMPPPPDESTIATIVEMGFTRARAEEALRRVETNSVEMAMEWLFTHAEDPVQEDDELARALALSLGNSSEGPKVDSNTEKTSDVQTEVAETKTPPIDDILAATMKLFQSSDSMAFPLTDLLVTFCNRNKGEDRPKVILYLIQQLKLSPLEASKETSTLCMISHTMALLLAEDVTAREIAVNNGIVSVSIDILIKFLEGTESQSELLVPKCISALLLILDNLLQSRPKVSSDSKEGSLPDSKQEQEQEQEKEGGEEKSTPVDVDKEKEKGGAFEKIFGKSTGYLTIEEGNRILNVACDLIKRHVPAMVMQAVLLLCARLTKTHTLALQFLENGGMIDLFSIPKSSFFPGYDTVASAIIRHLIEDPQTLQTAMELEVRQALSGTRHAGRVPPRAFLTSMAPLISRDPEVFMKAAASVCQLETTGGRTVVVLSKEKEKEKSKAPGVEIGISENKFQDGPAKCGKAQKKIPANLTQVVDHLLEIISKYSEEDCVRSGNAAMNMEIDESTANKGKMKVDETRKESDSQSERSAGLAKVTFVLKLLSDILLMYVHAVGIILKRDLEMCQLRGYNEVEYPGHGGIVHHVTHRLLHPSMDNKSATTTSGSDEWRGKLSEKASWFLVVLCGRSSEGRRRVINVLVKALSSFANSANSSSKGSLLPDKRVLAFVDLVYSILSKNSSSSNVPGSGCSPDIAKGMIDGGMIPCLSSILQVLDLDHPDAPKVVNIIVKAMEGLTRAANAVEQIPSSDLGNKKKSVSLSTGSDNQMPDNNTPVDEIPEGNNNSQHEIADDNDTEQHDEETTQDEGGGGQQSNLNQPPAEQELRIEMDETEEMEDGGVLRDSDQIEMTFHVEGRGGDEDDDMGDDGEDDEDDEDGDGDGDGDDEDEDIAEDGTALMSLADTDVEDHDETGLGDEYQEDDMVDEEDDDYHENRVIEVRWREALDGVLGQPGGDSGLIDIAAEPFEGVNVDDLFGLRRPLGFDRRRQQSRTSFDRSGTEGNGIGNGNGLQHPLLLRPSQSGDLGSIRELESLSGGSFDVAHFYMFDAPVLPFDHVQQSSVFGDRVGIGGAAPPPLSDFSVGLELRAPGRRGPGDGRWTDDGQPQAGGQAAAIAQAVEEQFMSQLRPPSTTTSTQRQHSDSPLPNDNQHGGETDQNNTPHQDLNEVVENVQVQPNTAVEEQQADGHTSQDNAPNSHDNMEIGEGNVNVNEQQDLSATDEDASNHLSVTSGDNVLPDVDMNVADPDQGGVMEESDSRIAQQDNNGQPDETGATNADAAAAAPNANGIDPTFLEALPADLRAEVLASQQAQSAPPPPPVAAPAPVTAEDIDPEFLAALPPDIQAEVLAQQRAQRVAHQAEGQPVDMDNASIIATFPADLREEVLLTSSEAVLSALPSPLLAEAQMLRDRAMSHYQARSLFGNSHRLNNNRRNGLGFDRQTVIDRGVGVTIGRRTSSALLENLKVKEVEGDPLLDPDALKALIRLLRLAQPLGKGLLQRLFLNLCAHSYTRATLVFLLLYMIKMETEGPVGGGGLTTVNSQRLYGCQSNVVYGRSQLLDGLPPLVLRRVLEILTYLATNHSSVANLLFYFDSSLVPDSLSLKYHDKKNDKGKEKVVEGGGTGSDGDIPILLFVKLLNQPLFLRSIAHLEQVMGLLQVVVYTAASKVDSQSHTEQEQAAATASSQGLPVIETATASNNPPTQGDSSSAAAAEPSQDDKSVSDGLSTSDDQKSVNMYDIFMKLPQPDLHNLCSLLGHEGLSDKVYLLTGEVLKKLASVAPLHRKFFIVELSDLAHSLSSSAIKELITLRNTHMLGLSAGSMAGAAVLRILQTLSSLTVSGEKSDADDDDNNQEHVTMWKLNVSLEPLWQELSECISVTETQLAQSSFSSVMSNTNTGGDHVQGQGSGSSSLSPPLPPGTQRLLPFIEAFLVLCEKLQANSSNSSLQQEDTYATAREVKELSGSSSPSGVDGAVTFSRFAEKHRRLLNAFVRQNPGLLEKSLSMMLKAPRLIDFDNKRSYFRSRIRQQHDQHLTGPLRISVRRAYVLEDSYNQLRMRPSQDLKGRLNVHFQGEEGIDAGGLTREWYQLLSRVIFDKGALLFTTGGNNATFQPNPNSVYQTEHLSYFKFVGRVVAKALFDGQLLDVYFTRSFYKHILGVKVTYHDIEAVDPDYYKNLKWLLENDVSEILDLTFSMDADEEKHILYEKTEVTDYELKPGGRNIRVTEETKHEYVDLVAEHILTNAIRPQINSFLEGFNELIPRDLISIFNDKELELLISGLPEIDLDDLKANAEYTGYTVASSVVVWFWEVVKAFNKEDRARLLQFVTGTSKVPLEGFKALQGISGPQRFQIHKAYGAPERLPSAHTCFNQLDLPEYASKEQLQERLLLAIHEASEGFGFG